MRNPETLIVRIGRELHNSPVQATCALLAALSIVLNTYVGALIVHSMAPDNQDILFFTLLACVALGQAVVSLAVGMVISILSRIDAHPGRILSYIMLTFFHAWVLSFNSYWVALKLGGLSLDRNSWYGCSLALSLLFAAYCQYYFAAKARIFEDFNVMDSLIGLFAPLVAVMMIASYFLARLAK